MADPLECLECIENPDAVLDRKEQKQNEEKDPDKDTKIREQIAKHKRERYATDPEYRERVKQYTASSLMKLKVEDPERYRERINKVVEYQKNKYATDPEYRKKVLDYSKRWRETHREEYYKSINRSRIRSLLYDHHEDLQNDPEHLSTDFLIALINRDDKQDTNNKE
jgi:galactokinase